MSEPQISPRIAELLVSHICHDLVSPVGAVSNGVEFVEEMGEGATADAMGLISSSVRQASVRLQCFRLAYGAAGSGGNITFDDLETAFGNYIEGGRVTLNWTVQPQGAVLPPDGFMKVVLNTLMLAAEAIPTNGELTIENNDTGVTISARAARVEMKEGVEAAFKHSTALEDLTPRTVHAYLTSTFAEFFGIGLQMTAKEATYLEFKVSYV